MVEYSIIKGTHPDVWCFPDLKTIAIYHEGLPPEEGGLLGTECFYLNYQQAAEDSCRVASERIQQGMLYVVRGKDRMIGGQIPSVTDYFDSHRWPMIYVAWVQHLMATKQKPAVRIIPDFYYQFKESNAIYRIDANHWCGLVQHVTDTGHIHYPREDRERELVLISPLAHFPKMKYVTSLNEAIFYNPSDPGQLQKFQSWYGSFGQEVHLRCQQIGRIIRMSEIVIPDGFGFIISFSSIGLDINYTIPFEDFMRTEKTLEVWAASGYTPRVKTAKNMYRHDVDPAAWGYYPSDVASVWDRRDQWIQCWIMGGKVPIDPSEILYYYQLKNAVDMKECPYLEDLYPVEIKRKQSEVSWFQMTMMYLRFAVAVVNAYYGNAAPLLSLYTEIIIMVIDSIGGKEIAKYTKMASLLVTAVLIKKFKSDVNVEGKVTKAIMKMSTNATSKFTMQQIANMSMNIEQAVGILNEALSNDQIAVLSAIAYQKDKNLNDLIDGIAKIIQSQIGPEYQAGEEIKDGMIANLTKFYTKEKKSQEFSGNLLIGAAVVGLALFWKYKGK